VNKTSSSSRSRPGLLRESPAWVNSSTTFSRHSYIARQACRLRCVACNWVHWSL